MRKRCGGMGVRGRDLASLGVSRVDVDISCRVIM